MESQRSFLFIALLIVSYLLFQQWQIENAPIVTQPAINQSFENTSNSNGDFVPESSEVAMTTPNVESTTPNAQLINITTDVFKIQINTRG